MYIIIAVTAAVIPAVCIIIKEIIDLLNSHKQLNVTREKAKLSIKQAKAQIKFEQHMIRSAAAYLPDVGDENVRYRH